MTHVSSALFLTTAAATLTAGWMSDWLVARGDAVTSVRKSAVAGGLLLSSVIAALSVVRNREAAITLLFVSCVGYGIYSSNHWAVSQTLAGPAMAGRWTSLQNGIGNLSGIAAPWIAGAILQFNGSSRPAFLVTGGVSLAGAALWGVMLPRVVPVPWKDTAS